MTGVVGPLGDTAPVRALFDLPAAHEPSDAELAAPVPALRAVLFDFSNTLFHMIGADEWLRRVAADTGRALDDAEVPAILDRLEAASRDPEVIEAQHGRDLDAGRHREAMRVWFAHEPFLATDPDAAWARVVAGDSWIPYPDTAPVLAALATAGIPVGVVSDIAWDIREHAVRAGVDHLVGTWVISGEVGAEKPDPELFRRACDDLGVDPRATLMVGDNPARDGGAAALGCRTLVLAGEHRTGERGLFDVLALLGLEG